VQLFKVNWERLKAIQDRVARQKGGEGRDLPYLAALLLKRRKLSEFRILKGQKPPPPPLWAQSASNMGIENAFDNGGWTCLHHAVARGHLELVYFMVKKGWEVNRKNQHMQRSPLRLAVDTRNLDMIRLLLQVPQSRLIDEPY